MNFLKHPKTNKPDVILTLTAIAVLAAVAKFLMEGVEFSLFGHVFNAGHTESTAYATFLSPLLGAHSYMDSKLPFIPSGQETRITPDNPDAD